MSHTPLGIPQIRSAEKHNLSLPMNQLVTSNIVESTLSPAENQSDKSFYLSENFSATDNRPDPLMPQTGPLIDRYGRIVHDLRISLTDKCNLRCSYCMPSTDINYISPQTQLAETHFRKIIRCALRLGITTFRFTGGEPLLSPLVVPLIGYTSTLAAEQGISIDIALTTNGIQLAEKIEALIEHGLQRVTVSLDTVDPQKFLALTSKNKLNSVIQGIDACLEKHLPLKLNTVLYNQESLHDIPALLAFACRKGISLRFIEQMPLTKGLISDTISLPTASYLRQHLNKLGILTPSSIPRASAPAQMYIFQPRQEFAQEYNITSQPIEIGIIAAMSEPFCSSCDRTRISSDGRVRNCLFSDHEFDLNPTTKDWDMLTESEIILQWRKAMWDKAASYTNDVGEIIIPKRGMNAIGG